MSNKSTIKRNILLFIENKGITKYKLYKLTGITRGVLDQDTGLSEENTAKFIACFPEVDVRWLLTGAGEMINANKENPKPEIISHDFVGNEDDLVMSLKKTIHVLENSIQDKNEIIDLLRLEIAKDKMK